MSIKPPRPGLNPDQWETYREGYRAGQDAMRERAAMMLEKIGHPACAFGVSVLPIEDEQ